MTATPLPPPGRPAALLVDAARGALSGGDGRYEKLLPDLEGLYRDADAYRAALAQDSGAPVYWVESSTVEQGPGALTVGTSTLAPGRIGEEFAMTRGHLHARPECAELYYGLSGRGVLLLETLDGQVRAEEVTPGRAVHVPGHWVHRSINVGDEPFSTLFCYATDAGQDYGVIADAGGMRHLVVRSPGGWALAENPDHRGYRGSGGSSGSAGPAR
jgi:glucose-6-phosphate isomerase, archaeal